MTTQWKPVLALFYCQNVPESSEQERQALEKIHGGSIRLFPIPCSGRLEPVHLLRALEEFADAAYVITCPEGACRYFEGNRRAKKRVGKARTLITSIGLEADRVGIVVESKTSLKPLSEVAGEVLEKVALLGPSPVLHPRPMVAEKNASA
jgi:F420-non-reducing hydrogenase iron-sulfur subunit